MSLDQWSRSPAIELFVERARSIRHDFELTQENVPVVAEICRRLDGLPLAIELAVARTKVLSLQSLNSRLGSRLRVLSDDSGQRVERHQTVRNVIAWSYDLLDHREQSLFPMLGVFIGGCSLATVETMLECIDLRELDALSLIGSLVDKSLLRSMIGEDGEMRFTMFETTREFSLDVLQTQGLSERARRAHAETFARLAEQIDPNLRRGNREQWDRLIRTEQDNIRAALRWSIDHAEPDFGLRILGSLTYWYFRDSYEEGDRWCVELLGQPAGDPYLRARALVTAAVIAWGRGDVIATATYLAQAEQIAVPLENEQLLRDIFSWSILASMGDLTRSHEYYERSIALATSNDIWSQELGSMFHGLVECMHGNVVEGRADLDRTVALGRRENDSWAVGASLGLSGALDVILGDIVSARSKIVEAISLLKSSRDRKNHAAISNVLAGIERLEGNLAHAFALHQSSLLLCREIGELGSLYVHLCGFALLLAQLGEPDDAVTLFSAATALAGRSHLQPVPLTDILSRSAAEVIPGLRASITEERYDRAWNRGETMSPSDAVEHAAALEFHGEPE